MLARQALERVQDNPREAQRMAARALALARKVRDSGAASTAQRVLGLAARELWDLRRAAAHLRGAIRTAQRAGDAVLVAEAQMSLSQVLAFQGRSAEALQQADLAASVLPGGNAKAQRASVFQILGRLDEAAAESRRALAALRRAGDGLWQARCLNNWGVIETWRANWGAAERLLGDAERLYEAHGQELAAADVRWNRGFLAGRRGDVAGALAVFDQVEDYYATAGVRRAHLQLDRGEVLLSARLLPEARAAAEAAVVGLQEDGRPGELAEARLLLSQVALAKGDPAEARAMAERARRAFAAHGRTGWVALARQSLLRARWLEGARSPSTHRAARETADALARIGWTGPALQARVVAARIALARRRPELARSDLRGVGSRTGPAEVRIGACHARALLHLATGDGPGVQAALEAGMRILDEHRAVLGATELRTRASWLAHDLAELGLRLAVEADDPARVLAWAERWRAGTLLMRPARPPNDAALAADLAGLRATVARLGEEALAGRDTTPFLRRQQELEASIRRRTLHGHSNARPEWRTLPPVSRLVRALEGRALVEIVELSGRTYAVVATEQGVRVRVLGPMAEIVRELEALRFTLQWLARGGTSDALEARAGIARAGAERLDGLLLRDLREDIGGRPVVVVPTGELHSLPWSLLPSIGSRPVAVAPSAATWYRSTFRDRGSEGRRPAVLVAGPGLDHAEAEVSSIRRGYGRWAHRFTGRSARCERVMAALDGAPLAHVAAHGRFRADNPLFSSLRLADGPLTVYDLERLGEAPRVFVLSACDSGLDAVHPGDELMGLSAALFSVGTDSLVATVAPVNDRASRPLMVRFHRALRAGHRPAAALARARAGMGADPVDMATAAAFVCFGAG